MSGVFAISLDEALSYSVSSKQCTDVEIVKADRLEIYNLVNNW